MGRGFSNSTQELTKIHEPTKRPSPAPYSTHKQLGFKTTSKKGFSEQDLYKLQKQRVDVICEDEKDSTNEQLYQVEYKPYIDRVLAEVFTIGVTILSSATLQDCKDVYANSPHGLREDRLSSHLKTIKQNYSFYLYQTIAGMLAINPQERKRCSSILAELQQHSEKILNLQSFQPKEQPLLKQTNKK